MFCGLTAQSTHLAGVIKIPRDAMSHTLFWSSSPTLRKSRLAFHAKHEPTATFQYTVCRSKVPEATL